MNLASNEIEAYSRPVRAANGKTSRKQKPRIFEAMYRESVDSPETFWPRMASDLHWFKGWEQLLDWSNPPFAKWFLGGKLNVAYNCLDRHLDGPRKNKAAIVFEGEPGDSRVITYAQLHRQVCQFANVLKGRGVKAGDRVAIYMPMIPEAVVAMLACLRIGAGHTVIFGGFSAEALADRIEDAQATALVTADGGWRRGKVVELKPNADAALAKCPCVKSCVVVRRTGTPVSMTAGRDLWYHEAMEVVSPHCHAEALDSEHLSFILYTSGTTGKPKGVVHTTAGYLLGAHLTCKHIFELNDGDVYWCTADIGWVTGHTYVVYGPLSNGATVMLYEGAPNYPRENRFWQIIEKHGVTVFYTAPTAIRAFIKWGDALPKAHDLSSLRLLGTVGEPINPKAWHWYYEVIGGGRCPIVDTYWQTETGAIICTPLPGITRAKPGSCIRPFWGVDAAVVDKQGQELPLNANGYLVIRKPWPSMIRTVWGDDERFKRTYFGEIPDAAGKLGATYFTGDGARLDHDGDLWVTGRVDDVVNVAGHRLGTAEVESALVAHESVAEAAVVGRADEMKGQALCAFVTLRRGVAAGNFLREDLKGWVAKQISAIAKPDDIRFTDALPKTRSGKIMRRLLRDIAGGKETVGDTTTLEDYSVLAALRENEE